MPKACNTPHCRAFSPLTVEAYLEDRSLFGWCHQLQLVSSGVNGKSKEELISQKNKKPIYSLIIFAANVSSLERRAGSILNS